MRASSRAAAARRGRSYASVLQLGATSGTAPGLRARARPATAPIPQSEQRRRPAATSAPGSSGDWLWFGLSTYAEWAKIGTLVQPLRRHRHHGRPAGRLRDLRDHRGRHRRAAGRHRSTSTTSTASSTSQPVNFSHGDVDTNVFDSNVLMLPVSQGGARPRTGRAGRSRYTVGDVQRASNEADTDIVGPVGFDAAHPGAPHRRRSSVPRRRRHLGSTTTSPGSRPVKALVLHLHGATGKRAEVLVVARQVSGGGAAPRRSRRRSCRSGEPVPPEAHQSSRRLTLASVLVEVAPGPARSRSGAGARATRASVTANQAVSRLRPL